MHARKEQNGGEQSRYIGSREPRKGGGRPTSAQATRARREPAPPAVHPPRRPPHSTACPPAQRHKTLRRKVRTWCAPPGARRSAGAPASPSHSARWRSPPTAPWTARRAGHGVAWRQSQLSAATRTALGRRTAREGRKEKQVRRCSGGCVPPHSGALVAGGALRRGSLVRCFEPRCTRQTRGAERNEAARSAALTHPQIILWPKGRAAAPRCRRSSPLRREARRCAALGAPGHGRRVHNRRGAIAGRRVEEQQPGQRWRLEGRPLPDVARHAPRVNGAALDGGGEKGRARRQRSSEAASATREAKQESSAPLPQRSPASKRRAPGAPAAEAQRSARTCTPSTPSRLWHS